MTSYEQWMAKPYAIVNMLSGLEVERHASGEEADARLFGYWRKGLDGSSYAVTKQTWRGEIPSVDSQVSRGA